jgi:PAS domain-containing protein
MLVLRSRGSKGAAITAFAFALIAVDYLAGPLTQTPLLYVLPIGLAAWFLGKIWGLGFAVCLAAARAVLAFAFWQDVFPPALIIGNLGLRLCVFILIAEAVRRHAGLHALQKRRLDLILEHLPVGVGYTDAKGRIVEANAAARSIWGGIKRVGPEGYGEYRGRYPGGEWLAPDQWAVDRALREGRPVLKEVVDIVAFDGTRKTILNSAVRVADEADRTVGAIFVNEDVTEELRKKAEREDLIRRLEESMANVRTLKGMLPICASCKKVRDDAGYWNRIEDYMRDHADVQFSHGICPECAARIYPEYMGRGSGYASGSDAEVSPETEPSSSPAEDD